MSDDPEFLGIVEVPLWCLILEEGVGERPYDPEHGRYLSELFDDIPIDHRNPNHRVDAYVDHTEVPFVLDKLGFSKRQLQETVLSEHYPRLEHRLIYTHGRHRIEGKKIQDPEFLWTANLFSTDIANLKWNVTVNKNTEQFKHEMPYSDGHIYSKIRYYEDLGDLENQNIWKARWKIGKRKTFRCITDRPELRRELDMLRHCPALIHSLQLGNYPKWFLLHLERHMVKGIKHIRTTWLYYCNSDEIDIVSVRQLEGLAPIASASDRQRICEDFANGVVFSRVQDRQRRLEIERRVLGTTYMIPSMQWLQENMKYLAIAAQFIWARVVPEKMQEMAQDMNDDVDDDEAEEMDEESKVMRRQMPISLGRLLSMYWDPSARPLIEVREGVFQPVFGPPSFNLVYSQLILSALRQFPYLGGGPPLVDRGGGPRISRRKKQEFKEFDSLSERFNSLSQRFISLSYKRARLLGLQNQLIEKGASGQHVKLDLLPEEIGFDEVEYLNRVDRRWGRPHTSRFHRIQRAAFLPQFAQLPRTGMELSVVFIQRDFMEAFFKPCAWGPYDLQQPSVSVVLPEQPKKAGRWSRATGHHGDVFGSLSTIREEVRRPPYWDSGILQTPFLDDAITIDGKEMSATDEDVIMVDRDQESPTAFDFNSPSCPTFEDPRSIRQSGQSFPEHGHETLRSAAATSQTVSTLHLTPSGPRSAIPTPQQFFLAGPAGSPTLTCGTSSLGGPTLDSSASHAPRSTVPSPSHYKRHTTFSNGTHSSRAASIRDTEPPPSFRSSQQHCRSTVPTPAQSASLSAWLTGISSESLDAPLAVDPFQHNRRSTIPAQAGTMSTFSPSSSAFPSRNSTDHAIFSAHSSLKPRSVAPTPPIFHSSYSSQSSIAEHGNGNRHLSFGNISNPRSTCPTPPSFPNSMLFDINKIVTDQVNPLPATTQDLRPLPSAWQGFIESDDEDMFFPVDL